METRDQQEEKNKRIGWLTSVGIQLVLLLIFYFIVAWREPFPPIPEYGIELGFTTSAGASSSASTTNQVEEVTESEEVIEESQETDVEEIPTEEVAETVEQETVSEETVESADPSVEETGDLPVVEESPQPEQETAVQSKPKEQVDQRAVMAPTASDSEGESDVKGEGEEEKEEVDQRAIMGNSGSNTGSSEGASLSLAGWIWIEKPDPDDKSSESGTLVFDIAVDSDGFVTMAKHRPTNISPALIAKYRKAVTDLTFVRTSAGTVAERSVGTITFRIKR